MDVYMDARAYYYDEKFPDHHRSHHITNLLELATLPPRVCVWYRGRYTRRMHAACQLARWPHMPRMTAIASGDTREPFCVVAKPLSAYTSCAFCGEELEDPDEATD